MSNTSNFFDIVIRSIKDKIEKEGREILEKHKQDIAKELDEKVRTIIVETGVEVSRWVKIEEFGEEISIVIRQPKV